MHQKADSSLLIKPTDQMPIRRFLSLESKESTTSHATAKFLEQRLTRREPKTQYLTRWKSFPRELGAAALQGSALRTAL
jgi:hypothetical protein